MPLFPKFDTSLDYHDAEALKSVLRLAALFAVAFALAFVVESC